MEWNIYKDWLDPVLYRQMVSMIYQLYLKCGQRSIFKTGERKQPVYGICERSMEEEYNLHYTWRSIRAYERAADHDKTGLPGSWACDLQGHPAFRRPVCLMVPQKSGFWKQFGKVLGEKDLCYLVVRCLLANKRSQALGGCPAPVSIWKKWRK